RVRVTLDRRSGERVKRARDGGAAAKRDHDDSDPSHSLASPIRLPPVAVAVAEAYLPCLDHDAAPVSVVVVTHNHSELIGDCLRAIDGSLRRHGGEVIVIDNASTDATRDLLAASEQPVKVIELSENIGFAAAVNLAMTLTRGRYLALVNS